jgi:hypothetical protein
LVFGLWFLEFFVKRIDVNFQNLKLKCIDKLNCRTFGFPLRSSRLGGSFFSRFRSEARKDKLCRQLNLSIHLKPQTQAPGPNQLLKNTKKDEAETSVLDKRI